MFKQVVIALVVIAYIGKSQAIQIIWNNNVSLENNKIDELEIGKSDEDRKLNWFLIFPGTKWCGPGNIAANENDFGRFSDTDKCCRAHDFCDDIIEGHQSRHNLTNPVSYTRLNCKCDKTFHTCLKQVNSIPSTRVGHIYFTDLGTQCFRKEHPVTRCTKHTYIPRRKCIAYEYDTSKDKLYQWFDLPNF